MGLRTALKASLLWGAQPGPHAQAFALQVKGLGTHIDTLTVTA